MLFVQIGWPIMVSSTNAPMDKWCINHIKVFFSDEPEHQDWIECKHHSRRYMNAKYPIGVSTLCRGMYLFKDVIIAQEWEGKRTHGVYTVSTSWSHHLNFNVYVNNKTTKIMLFSDGRIVYVGDGLATLHAKDTKEFIRNIYKVRAKILKGVEIEP